MSQQVLEFQGPNGPQEVSAANPLPTTTVGGPATTNVNITQVGGNAVTNDVPVGPFNLEVSGLSAAALNVDLVPATDVSGYRFISLHVTGTFVGVLTFQAWNDPSAASLLPMQSMGIPGLIATSYTGAGATNIVWYGPVLTRFFRVRMTSYTSGTATAILELSTLPPPVESSAAQRVVLYGTSNSATPGDTVLLVDNVGNLRFDPYTVAQDLWFGDTPGTITASGNSPDLFTLGGNSIVLQATVSAVSGTNPTLVIYIEMKDADNNYYAVYTSPTITTATQIYMSCGPGMTTNVFVAKFMRIRWVITGTNPVFTRQFVVSGR